jgi:hypothetical protein
VPCHYSVSAGQLSLGVLWPAARVLLGIPRQAINKEHDMPNRGELAIPARPADFGAKDAWMVIGFCAIGWLMSISLAASLLGSGALPKFPWG